jgi:hypothetical protein
VQQEKQQLARPLTHLQMRTYRQMVESQRGFFLAIYGSSVIIATAFVLLFVAFIFKFGFMGVHTRFSTDPSFRKDWSTFDQRWLLNGESNREISCLESLRKLMEPDFQALRAWKD